MIAVLAAAPEVVLAHGGGAPEALTIGAPIVVLLVFAVLERRARARERAQAAESAADQADAPAAERDRDEPRRHRGGRRNNPSPGEPQ